MKRQWHVQTRLLVTFVGLTGAILLAVGLVFNLFIHSYIRSRVSTQLDALTAGAQDVKRGGKGRRFDEYPDRVIGTRGNAVVLDGDGTLLSVVHGENQIGAELSGYFSDHTLGPGLRSKTISLDSGTYGVSVVEDPVQTGAYLVCYVDVTPVLAFTSRVNAVLGIIILGALVLALFLSRRFAESVAEPVRKLSDFADSIGSGDLSPRELRFQDVEFDQLAAAMNRMAAALTEANRKQETFFQNVSHELRTPLTSIRGSAEGILYGVMSPETSSRTILTETDRLSELVEDILYLSRAGKGAGELQTLDLREVLSLCVSEQRAEAEKRALSFRFDFDDAPAELSMREQDAQRLVGNLLSNAIRYAKSEIRLSCRREEDFVVAYVADDGPGIAEGDLPHIFERFYKGAGGKHGIGLSIVQTVAEAYQGRVEARNDGGAVFTVYLPIHRV